MKERLNNSPERHDNYNTQLMLLARCYYNLGFTPIPCAPRTKKPVCQWERWQYQRPSWNELEVVWYEAIQRFGQTMNVATILGEAHGLCAVDIDEPEKFRLARQQVGLTEDDLKTWTTRSHRGGALIFRYPNGYHLPSKINNPNWGAELLGNERILVLPPSIHPSGTRYRWLVAPHKVELREIPRTFLEAFGISKKFDAQSVKSETHNDNGELPQWARDLISLLRPYWFEGQRHDLALALSGVFARRGVDKSLAERILSTLANEQADSELRDRIRAMMDTYDRLAEDKSILAWSGLERIVDEATLQALDNLLPRNGLGTVIVVSEPIKRPQNPCTDLGNAERLVRLFGDRIRYVPQWGWLVWDGRRWLRDKGNALVTKLAEETVKTIYEEVAKTTDPTERTRLAKWAIASETKQRIVAMVDLAAPICRAEPEEFDRDPYLLNCLNGTVDLRTGRLLPHNPDLKITKLCPVEYNPHATAPTWLKFLGDIFMNDAELIAFIKRALGYSITGDVCENVLFICWGLGSNGKTTLMNTITQVLGDYAKQIPPDTLLNRNYQSDKHPTTVATLCGVRFAVAQETEENKHLAAARVKALTGGDVIAARFMHKDYFEFKATHKIWLSTNHKPIITDTTYAMWRRILLIPFRAFFDETNRDKHMGEKLLAEKEGILAWLVEGCLEWQRQGLNPPPIVSEATKEYQSEMDKLQAWLEACCVLDPRAVTPFSALYASYESWCRLHDEEPLSRVAFSNRLTEKGFTSETLRIGGKVTKVRKGIRLREDDNHDGGDGNNNEACRHVTAVTAVTAVSINSHIYTDSEKKYGDSGNSSNTVTQSKPSSSLTETEKAQHSTITDPPKSNTNLSQSCNEVDTEAWLANEVGFVDAPPSTDHRPNTDSHPPSGDKPPPTPQPSANPPPKPLKSHKNLSPPKELRPEELESEERFACPNCGNWRRVPVSTVMLVGPPRCPVCGSTMNPAQEPPPIVGGDKK